MAGNHRNHDLGPTLADKGPLIAIVVGTIALVVFLVWTLLDDNSPQQPTFETATPSANASPTPVNGPSANSPIDDLPRIAGAAPQRLRIGTAVDAGFDSSVSLDGDVLEAASPEELSRLEDRGEPGSPGEDTVVIIGQDRFDQKAALNDIAEVQQGDRIRLTTQRARLTYRIESSFKVASGTLPRSALFAEKRPGRLLLVATTYDDSGNRTGVDTVVVAHLTRAKELRG